MRGIDDEVSIKTETISMDINLIVAAGNDGAIGRKGDLIWHISSDLRRFKALTMGHPVIMGRKTWESLPKRPLPGRLNIVVTRNPDFVAEGALIAHSPEKALALCADESPFVMGGAQIYNALLPFATKIHLTRIDASCPDADAFLPLDEIEGKWHLDDESAPETTPGGVTYIYQTYSRH